jgi:hypothetical protein
MKKAFAALFFAASLIATSGCTGWAHAAPKPLEKTAMEAEIRKNWAGDKITGLSLDIDDNGVVTVSGHLATQDQVNTAVHDASKVKDVTRVINQISVP